MQKRSLGQGLQVSAMGYAEVAKTSAVGCRALFAKPLRAQVRSRVDPKTKRRRTGGEGENRTPDLGVMNPSL
jgi:hypothetical protein